MFYAYVQRFDGMDEIFFFMGRPKDKIDLESLVVDLGNMHGMCSLVAVTVCDMTCGMLASV